MADDQTDDSQKTEDPTPKRLREAREKGEITKSQEVNHWVMILGLAVVVSVMLPFIGGRLGLAMLPLVERPHAFDMTNDASRGLLADTLMDVALVLALPFAIFMIAALSAGFLQSGVNFSVEPLKPKLSKLSPLSGLKRIFGLRALVEFAKGLLKISLVALVVSFLVWPDREMIATLPELDLSQLLDLLLLEATRVLGGVLAVMTVIAGLDYLFQRYQHMKQLRMSRQEIKDEMKQSEGDPLVKSRLRQIRMERARQRMMAAVPEADVVVTNPTHFSIALKYDPETMEAPRLVAKGVDHLALRIREVARENRVPLVENRPLARALYEGVDIDQEIPPEHYKAVAHIIGYVMRLRGETPDQRPS